LVIKLISKSSYPTNLSGIVGIATTLLGIGVKTNYGDLFLCIVFLGGCF